jgi:hypothetical protein
VHRRSKAFLLFMISGVWLAPLSARGQAPRAAYQSPRTPWGDPDLQGNYTNKNEQSTPLERPGEFDGRRLDDVKGAELAALLAKREQQVLARAEGVGPNQFRDALDVTRGSRAWLIVDPPDGRMPAMTPEALRRIGPPDISLDSGIGGILNHRRGGIGSFGEGPFDGLEDFTLWDRCITRGLPGAMMPYIHGNSYQIVQARGIVAIRYEFVHDARIIPLDGRPHLSQRLQLELGDARGRWDGDTLVVETTNFKNRSTYRNANAATLRLIAENVPHGCDVCSRHRRQNLYKIASQLDCGVLALGHTADDCAESLMRNILFNGRIASLPPVSQSQKGTVRLIRPLCFSIEVKLATLRKKWGSIVPRSRGQ